jgi:hypothetical protein
MQVCGYFKTWSKIFLGLLLEVEQYCQRDWNSTLRWSKAILSHRPSGNLETAARKWRLMGTQVTSSWYVKIGITKISQQSYLVITSFLFMIFLLRICKYTFLIKLLTFIFLLKPHHTHKSTSRLQNFTLKKYQFHLEIAK